MAFPNCKEIILTPKDIVRFSKAFIIGDPEECWEWQRLRGPSGYGRFGIGRNAQRLRYAHRVSWTFFKGPIPKDLLILHRCDNPPCVNPNHLFLGTYDDNAKDRAAKGRNKYQRGEKSPRALLTEKHVREIVSALREGVKIKHLAVKYSVTRSAINNICFGTNWKHITAPPA